MRLHPATSYPFESTWRRTVRLETLLRLRWFAICGQSAAILTVFAFMDSSLPIEWCMIAVGASAWLNISLRWRYPANHRLTAPEAGASLAWDILQLTFLLSLTGGLENPFAFLLLAPVLISATALPTRMTVIIAGLAIIGASVVAFFHMPLPWEWRDDLRLPSLYLVGVWIALMLCICFIGIYAWQVAEESRQFNDALAAAELVLAREQHLTQLDGLAAAAAHELGTPLATIALVTKELAGELPKEGPIAEDIKLLGEQVKRCRDILAKLKSLAGGDAPFDSMPLAQLIEEVVQPHRFFDIAIDVKLPEDREGEPVLQRNPGVLYGLGNIVENAVDFAKETVTIEARWSADEVTVVISDDGPGLAPDIIARMGEPYLSRQRVRGRRRPGMSGAPGEEPSGLGLGVFIAKRFLERSGARIAWRNRAAPETGAVVEIVWPRWVFDGAEARPFAASRPLAEA
jgi:two-component system, sensor histidine kinase RegB